MRETKKAFNYEYYAKFKCKHCKEMYAPDKINKEMACRDCVEEREEIQQAPIYFSGHEFVNIEKEAMKYWFKKKWTSIKKFFKKDD